MKKRILFFMIAVFLLSVVTYAQDTEKDGTAFQTAIPVVFTQGKTTFTDIRNTAGGPPWYYTYLYKPMESDSYIWTQGRAVYYRVQMATSGDLKAHNWYSPNLGFTTLFLVAPLDPTKEPGEIFNCDSVREVASFNVGDFCGPESDVPENVSHGLGYLHVRNLPAGTYYIIAAGYKNSNGSVPNGDLRTTIIADLISEIPGEPGLQPELPNYSPVQYQYDLSGNRTKNIKKQ